MHKPPFARTILLALLSVSALPALADNAQRVHQTCSRYLDEQPDYYESRSARFSLRAMPQAAVKSAAPADLSANAAPMAEAAVGSVATRQMAPPRQNTERYGHYEPNPVHAVAEQPVSTFSIDVDTGSYANIRRFLTQTGRLPPADAVRIEEIINYFDYGYAKPTDGKPFAVHTETVDSPFRSGAKLIRIGIQAKEVSQAALPPANLVFLVDVSGSMYSRDKLPMVKYTLCTLAHQTRAQDRITLVTYADGNKVVLPPTPGNQRQKILAALDSLKAGGSTAGENAIQQAYQAAQRAYIRNGINRILLATDGDFNVGITDFNTLRSMVAEKRKSGISLTTLGFGSGNYNERLMEQLADAGDGNYSYIDSPEEAQKVLHRQLSSTLATVAQDVKIQVEFNPATVKEYRLIGYENRMLAREDFNNDQVDAGDIGAGHNVTALYEIIPAGQTGWLPESRYQAAPAANDKAASEYAFINLRYKLPGQSNSILINRPVAVGSKPLAQGSNATRQAVAAAAFGELLRGGKYSGNFGWPQTLELARNAQFPDRHGLRRQFVQLIEKAQQLSSKPQ
ncbi:VWA domain-containing protein [Eikenella sp. HMSC061C02]|uniref:vWA domain-containing protein n=1 Tax=Eikenella sp. HMSC061C02 TaxID=1715021 RepID=UPI0009F54BF4|nr:VWA domain-containing protein [Eikenella sp. HMSC061C02]MDN8581411.1 VWA domain-containing protein [Eikenella corrodens]